MLRTCNTSNPNRKCSFSKNNMLIWLCTSFLKTECPNVKHWDAVYIFISSRIVIVAVWRTAAAAETLTWGWYSAPNPTTDGPRYRIPTIPVPSPNCRLQIRHGTLFSHAHSGCLEDLVSQIPCSGYPKVSVSPSEWIINGGRLCDTGAQRELTGGFAYPTANSAWSPNSGRTLRGDASRFARGLNRRESQLCLSASLKGLMLEDGNATSTQKKRAVILCFL